MNNKDCHSAYIIRTKQQKDDKWKAIVVGTQIVNYGKTEIEAVLRVVDMVLPEDEKEKAKFQAWR